MNVRDVFNAATIAAVHTENASNKKAYLGKGLFPDKRKMGLDLKWIRTSKGLPVTLAASTFDAVSTIRSREGFKIQQTEMAFFRESMILKEADLFEIERLRDTNDPYADEVLARIFNDAEVLIEGAEVVPERMIMQLLAPENGSPKIYIKADNATYTYNYDADESYKTNNYAEISGSTDKWSDTENSDPLSDIMEAIDKVEDLTGNRPTRMIVSKLTMSYLKKNAKVRGAILAQNTTANIIVNEARVKEVFRNELGVDVIVYTKQYRDEEGTAQKFYPDGYATLIPDGVLGNTWHGVTPEERDLVGREGKDASVVGAGIAVSITVSDDPVHTKTTVSEVVLPSYERMDETYVIKCY